MNENESILESESLMGLRHSNPKGKIIKRASFFLDRLLRLPEIREIYKSLIPCRDSFEFAGKALENMNINYELCHSNIDSIPDSGPTIVTANHPFGGIDGLILIHMLSQKRKDIMVMANYFLGVVPELRPIFYLVDPFGGNGSENQNMFALKQAVKWVKQGGMLVTFPAGEVSHLTLKNMKIEDVPWNTTLGRLIHMTNASVLPVYFHGRNSIVFQIGGLIYSKIRTAMLPRELIKKKHATIHLKIGKTIPYNKIREIDEPDKLMDYLRFRTCLLGNSFGALDQNGRENSIDSTFQKKEKIIPAVDTEILTKEVSLLPPGQKLSQSVSQSVYYADAQQIPWVLREIGRLREITFRETGEGTGRAVDLDRFDQEYVHLFLWNEEKQEVIGAYRVGQTDIILPKQGKKGLYTHTLFNYKSALLNKLGPALEMGRTFVRREYQKSFSALLLLWKGIGRYVAQNPKYKILFGGVSITNDYQSCSRDLMVTFLKMNHFLPHLSAYVKARRPYKPSDKKQNTKTVHLAGGDLDEISNWVSGIEEDGKGVPVLLKQYLKLGGKILCFNVDNAFENALDGLIMVDLLKTDNKALKRYMGEEGFRRFKAYHDGEDDHQDAGPKHVRQFNPKAA